MHQQISGSALVLTRDEMVVGGHNPAFSLRWIYDEETVYFT